jgi:hypothetical protein
MVENKQAEKTGKDKLITNVAGSTPDSFGRHPACAPSLQPMPPPSAEVEGFNIRRSNGWDPNRRKSGKGPRFENDDRDCAPIGS